MFTPLLGALSARVARRRRSPAVWLKIRGAEHELQVGFPWGLSRLLAVSAAALPRVFEVFDGEQRFGTSIAVGCSPAAVGGFVRVGDPGGIEGTTVESVASYPARGSRGAQDTATVTVYPPRLPGTGCFAASREVDDRGESQEGHLWRYRGLKGRSASARAPVLVGEKAYYKIGVGPTSSQTKPVLHRYRQVDRQGSNDRRQDDGGARSRSSMRFVRGLPWESLALTAKTCTGVALSGRAARWPVHGLLPEQLAIMIVNAKVKDVFSAGHTAVRGKRIGVHADGRDTTSGEWRAGTDCRGMRAAQRQARPASCA